VAETNRLLNGRGSKKSTESSNLSPSTSGFSAGNTTTARYLTGSLRTHAVVAQLDRATGYELVGWGFESLRPHVFAPAADSAHDMAR